MISFIWFTSNGKFSTFPAKKGRFGEKAISQMLIKKIEADPKKNRYLHFSFFDEKNKKFTKEFVINYTVKDKKSGGIIAINRVEDHTAGNSYFCGLFAELINIVRQAGSRKGLKLNTITTNRISWIEYYKEKEANILNEEINPLTGKEV